MSFLPTNQLVSDRELAALIDELAQASRVESAHIGEAGSPSQTHALFRKIANSADSRHAVALLQHQSAVVRGYLVEHVIDHVSNELPDALDAVYPLLADATEVEEMSGCCIATMTVAQLTLQALRARCDRPAVQAQLLRAAYDASLGELRAEALQCIARQRPTEAAAIAQSWLRDGDDGLLAGAIRTLGMTASTDSAEALCALADSPKKEVRAAIASALGSLQHACIEPTLRKLLKDRENYVRLLAGASYVRTEARDPAIVRQLFRDPGPRVRNHVALSLAERANAEDIELLCEYLALEPSCSEVLSALRRTQNDSVTRFMREVLSGELGSDVLVRAQAVEYLSEIADDKSRPLFLRALHSSYIGERTAAAEGIAAIGARDAASSLLPLLKDANPHGRLAAARALVDLQAFDSYAAVKRAADRDTSWAKAEMTNLAQKLGAS